MIKKKLSLKVDVLHADKHKSQVDSISFGEFGQACPNYPDKFAMSLRHLKKKSQE